MHINLETLTQDIIDYCVPFFKLRTDREAILSLALSNLSEQYEVEFEGAAKTFTVHLVSTLSKDALIEVLTQINNDIGIDQAGPDLINRLKSIQDKKWPLQSMSDSRYFQKEEFSTSSFYLTQHEIHSKTTTPMFSRFNLSSKEAIRVAQAMCQIRTLKNGSKRTLFRDDLPEFIQFKLPVNSPDLITEMRSLLEICLEHESVGMQHLFDLLIESEKGSRSLNNLIAIWNLTQTSSDVI